MTTAWIVDTTALVAGLLTSNPSSPTARIVDAMLAARFTYLLSLELLSEYRSVLLRPKIRKGHGLNDAEVDALLEALARNAAVRAPSATTLPAPDPGDAHLWALLESDPFAVLITGDKPLLADPPRPGAVCTPSAFAALVLDPPSLIA